MNSHLPVMRLSDSSSVAAYDMNPESQTKTFRVLFYLLRTGALLQCRNFLICVPDADVFDLSNPYNLLLASFLAVRTS